MKHNTIIFILLAILILVVIIVNNSDKYEKLQKMNGNYSLSEPDVLHPLSYQTNGNYSLPEPDVLPPLSSLTNGNYSLPEPDVLPPLSSLTQNCYDTETSFYCTYLNIVAYNLTNIPYDYYDDYDSSARLFLLSELSKTMKNFVICEVFAYHCTNINSSYCGFIVEVYDYNSVKPIVFIILRGTINICEWMEDFNSELISPYWAPDIKIHSGFNNMYVNNDTKSIRYKLNNYLMYDRFIKTPYNTEKIIISGHSLGGAICNLITADLSLTFFDLRNITKIFTFAAPYCGDLNFVNLMNKNGVRNYSGLFAIINLTDFVPTTKPSNKYARPEYQLFIFKAGNNISLNPLNAHLMAAYIAGIRASADQFDTACNVPSGLNSWQRLCGYDLGIDMLETNFMTNKECQFCEVCPPNL